MSFTNLAYYLFLSVTLVLYTYLPKNWRTPILISASFIFYLSFNPYYFGFILNTVVVSYLAARFISSTEILWKKKAALYFSVTLELALLFVTKYWNPIAENTHLLSPLRILVPLGISFYSFQSIGYVVDVYRNIIPAEKNISRYALFVSFFPHLLAGPIEPAQHFIPQIEKAQSNQRIICAGVLLIVVGLFKKLVIADNMGTYVDLVFNNAGLYQGPSVALAIFLAKYQIYADFSGYTDIALGSALMFGFNLTENFNRPFFSKNITEYWNRWHMSLSQWIKNYIFYPLLSTPLTFLGARGLAIMTFFVLGLWHGATINFLIYGLIQGILIALDSSTKNIRFNFYKKSGLDQYPKALNALAISFTFFILVVPPTLFFRSPDFKTTLTLFQALMKPGNFDFLFNSYILSQGLKTAVIAAILYELADWIQKTKMNITEFILGKSMWVFYFVVALLLITIFAFGRFEVGSSFIYTQF